MAEFGPEQNGVQTWRPLIRDASGRDVFRDDEVYSTRHGVGITWLSTSDQLWILSADVGITRVDRRPDGSWAETSLRRGDAIPDEIRKYWPY